MLPKGTGDFPDSSRWVRTLRTVFRLVHTISPRSSYFRCWNKGVQLFHTVTRYDLKCIGPHSQVPWETCNPWGCIPISHQKPKLYTQLTSHQFIRYEWKAKNVWGEHFPEDSGPPSTTTNIHHQQHPPPPITTGSKLVRWTSVATAFCGVRQGKRQVGQCTIPEKCQLEHRHLTSMLPLQ